MADLLTDDELDLDEEERKRKAQPDAIGTPIPAPRNNADLVRSADGTPESVGSPLRKPEVTQSSSLTNMVEPPRSEAIGSPISLSNTRTPQPDESLAAEHPEAVGTPISSRYAGTERYGEAGPYAGAAEHPSLTGTRISGGVPQGMEVTPGLDTSRGEVQSIGPAIGLNVPSEAPTFQPSEISGMGPLAPRPNYERYERVLNDKAGVEKLHGFGGGLVKIAEAIGTAINPNIMAGIPGTRVHHQGDVNRARNAAEEENREISSQQSEREKQAEIGQKGALAEQENARAWALRHPAAKPERTGNPEADAYYSLRDEGKSPQEALEIIKGAGKQDKPIHHTPFEAFAFGNPDEKKAAQDFLEYEKRIGAKYRTPNEFDLRFKLYREDPETYRAMFGDKGQAADQRNRVADRAHAARMLNFFQHQRDQISKDFMIGDDEKAQRLREIDELQQPFMDKATTGGEDTPNGKTVNTVDILAYAQKNGISSIEARKHFSDEGYRIVPATPATAPGKGGDRVNVIHPDGTHGTIPRSQLKAAKRKGYQEVPAQ